MKQISSLFRLLHILAFAPLLLLMQACGGAGPDDVSTISPREVPSPASGSSELPNLYTAESGTAYLSWVEHASTGDSVTLKFATWEGEQWGSPRDVAGGDDWFVNWADYPSVVGNGDGPLASHWLHKIPGNRYSYEVQMRMRDAGEWGGSITPHSDGTATEHGFVSLLPGEGDGSVLALWLDGRRTADRAEDEYGNLEKAMTLRAAEVGADGSVSRNLLVDEAICDCCQTALARIPGGAIAAYRDRTEGEVRDISVSRYTGGSWSEPETVHADGWNIAGCPVNGPALASRDSTVVLAWFTGAGGENRVKAAVSHDGGNRFGEPVVVDQGAPLGRVDAAVTRSGRIYVSWLEEAGEQRASFLVREITISGIGDDGLPDTEEAAYAIQVAEMSAARPSGFPQMSATGKRLLFAWTGLEEGTRLHTAVMNAVR